jgi:hypothetical protein
MFKQLGVKKPDKFVGAGLGIRPDPNQFVIFKTRPPDVGFISTHLLIRKCYACRFLSVGA